MSSIQRILNKHAKSNNNTSTNQLQPNQENPNTSKLEQSCRKYLELQNNNPNRYEFNNTFLPASFQTMQKCKFPFGLFFQPFQITQQEPETRCDQMLRCLICKAYMNMYNKFVCNGNNFICIFCNKQQMLPIRYFSKLVNGQREDRNERKQLYNSSYSLQPTPLMNSQLCVQNTFVFLIDISSSAFQCQMLFYGISAIKQALQSEELDYYNIIIYTYDELLHYYDLSGNQPSRIIIDQNVIHTQLKNQIFPLYTNREKFFQVLESLQEIAKYNTKVKSNFFGSLNKVIQITKHLCPKIFILQSNEIILNEQMFIDIMEKDQSNEAKKKRNPFELTTNRSFFNKFASVTLNSYISFSFFFFSRTYKKLRVFGDLAKLTNSELFIYNKDMNEHPIKFYYEIYHLLTTQYAKQLQLQIYHQNAWNINAIYANCYKYQNMFTLRINNLEEKKKVALTLRLNPNYVEYPEFAMQIITHYIFNKKRRIRVTTLVKPVTNSVQHLYYGINFDVLSGILYKIYLTNLRMQNIALVRQRIIKAVGIFYIYLKEINKKKSIPDGSLSLFEGILSLIKSRHMNQEWINNNQLSDQILSERNFLQCIGFQEINTFFTPYLFRLSGMDAALCSLAQDQQFVYPESLYLTFNSIKEGIFLMDCSTHMYIFIAKTYDPQQLYHLFGVQNLQDYKSLTEENLNNQKSHLAHQTRNLISEIRARKYFGYIPLYITHFNKHNLHQRNFYLYFINDRYHGFTNFNMTLEQFFKLLETQSSL